jgi:hypothetical protein
MCQIHFHKSTLLLIGMKEFQPMIQKSKVSFLSFLEIYLGMMRLALSKLDNLEKMLDSSGWGTLVDDKKEGVVISSKIGDSGLTAIKSEGVIEFTPIEIFKVIGNSDYRKVYDATFD